MGGARLGRGPAWAARAAERKRVVGDAEDGPSHVVGGIGRNGELRFRDQRDVRHVEGAQGYEGGAEDGSVVFRAHGRARQRLRRRSQFLLHAGPSSRVLPRHRPGPKAAQLAKIVG